MSDDEPQVPDTLTGRCMCGAVTYKITEKPIRPWVGPVPGAKQFEDNPEIWASLQ